MLRIVLLNAFMFLLPFIVYGLYVLLVQRNRRQGGVYRGAPLKWLALTGLVLAVIGLFSLVSFTGGSPEGTYEPPRYEDGTIRPGRIR